MGRRLGLGGLRFEISEEIRAQFVDVAQFRQRRQVGQRGQVEVGQEFTRGRENRRAARHVAMADDLDPVAFVQGLDDAAADRDAPDVLDFGARDRLAVRDDRERLQQRARVARFALLPQAIDPCRAARAGLEAPTATDLREFNATTGVIGREFGQRGLQIVGRGRFLRLVGEHAREAFDVDRRVGRHDGGFEQDLEGWLLHGGLAAQAMRLT